MLDDKKYNNYQHQNYINHRIENIEADIKEFKESVRESLKEQRQESKEDRKLFMEAISTLKENVVRITTLMEIQNEKINDVKFDMHEIKKSKEDGSKKVDWIGFFFDNAKPILVITILFVAISLNLLGVLTVEQIIRLFGFGGDK